MSEDILLFQDQKRLQLRAWFLGTRIDFWEFERKNFLSMNPLTIKAGENGYAVLLRFGVVILIELTELEENRFIQDLSSFLHERFRNPELEEADIVIDQNLNERIDASGRVVLRKATIERLQVVSIILAKSVVLAHYEKQVANVFNRIEKLAGSLKWGRIPSKGKALLKDIGDVLTIQAWTVGRVEVTEKPELIWDDLQLDRLYERLANEYELRDRDLALSRKLELISNTAEMFLELMHSRQSIRVEWYIVVLIIIEVVIILYEMFTF